MLALGVILVIGLVVYLPHVVHGGLAADDWVDASRFYFHHGSGFRAAVAAHQTPSRTVWAVIDTIDWWAMGIHPVPHLLQTVVASLIEAGLILAVARRLGMPLFAGTTLALLVLLWPPADSSRLWATGAQQTIALVLLLAGFLVALIGLDHHGPWSVLLHCLAVALYVASMLDYELSAPVILLAGIVYVQQAGWRRAGWRWALDAIAVVTTVSLSDLAPHSFASLGVSGSLDHARVIGNQALTLAARSVLPIGSSARPAVLIGMGGVVVVGVVLAVRGPFSQRQGARRSIGYLAAGAAVVVAGYLMIVPANPGYQPDTAGVQNRIDAVAALGFALIVIALCRIVGQVLALMTRGSGRRAAGFSTALAVLVIAMGSYHIETDASHWDRSSVEQQETLTVIRHLVPNPTATTTVFTFGRSGYTAPSIPIFGGGGNNDLVGAVRVMWKNGSVRGFPVLDEMHFVCGAHSVRLLDTGVNSTTAYGRAEFINVLRSKVVVPRNQHECSAVTAAFPYAPVNELNS